MAETGLRLDLAELGISTTNDANNRLVAMEKKAFEFVRNSEAARHGRCCRPIYIVKTRNSMHKVWKNYWLDSIL